jgi:cold shock protein
VKISGESGCTRRQSKPFIARQFSLRRLAVSTPRSHEADNCDARCAVRGRVHPADKEADMASGTVKWFNAQKGYGFIQPDQGGKDVFVHISAVERAGLSSLAEGQKVNYEVARDRGKEAAANLALVR